MVSEIAQLCAYNSDQCQPNKICYFSDARRRSKIPTRNEGFSCPGAQPRCWAVTSFLSYGNPVNLVTCIVGSQGVDS